MMQIVNVEEAVGLPLAHDITEIWPGEFKHTAFQRGYVVKSQDVDHLRRLGKDNVYIQKIESNQMHEDDAVREIADALCGEGVSWEGQPREGKLALNATRDGLFKVDVDILTSLNELGDIMCATQHTNTTVLRGKRVAATRAIPLLIARSTIQEVVRIAKQCKGVLRVLPLRQVRVGVLITGNEVFYGRIQDRFEPIIRKKVEEFNGTVLDVVFLPDDDDRIGAAALDLITRGAEVLITTGGMSVDPDDRTRFALLKAGGRNMLYGAPVLPGNMFMIVHLNDVPVLGVPAGGLFAAATVFDLIYPRVLAGEEITRKDIASLGHGGLCLKCEPCRYPSCPFGKAN